MWDRGQESVILTGQDFDYLFKKASCDLRNTDKLTENIFLNGTVSLY